MTTTLEPTIAQFLAHLHRGGSWSCWRTCDRTTDPDRHQWLLDWRIVNSSLVLPDSDRYDIYVSVHPLRAIPPTNRQGKPMPPRYVSGQTAYVAAANCLFADFDAKDFGGDSQALFQHVLNLPVMPSVVIWSGNGTHCYWLFHDPFTIDSDDHRAAIAYIQKTWVDHIGGDPDCRDLARHLRLPFTHNHKYSPARLVAPLVMDLSRAYTIEDFTIRLPAPLPKPTPAQPRQGANTHNAMPITRYNEQTPIGDLLERHGYRWCGRNRMISPFSGSGRDGVDIFDDTNKCKVYTDGDPLADGYPKSPFDVVMILDHAGNRDRALGWIKVELL